MKSLLALGLVVLVLDQVTKYLAITYLVFGQSVPVIPGLFDLTLVYNKGAAFGMFSTWSDGVRRGALLLVSVLAIVVVFRFMRNEAKDDRWSRYALAGILAGALGNIVDRMRFDAVVDFLDFYWREHHWPAFNIADSAISVGVTVLIVRMVFANEPSPKAQTQD